MLLLCLCGWAQPVGRASVLLAVFKQYERMGKKSKKRGAPEELPKEPRQERKPAEKMTKAELLAELKALRANEPEKEEGKLVMPSGFCLPEVIYAHSMPDAYRLFNALWTCISSPWRYVALMYDNARNYARVARSRR